jgi:F0F1-type ATP synthase assembly protein I
MLEGYFVGNVGGRPSHRQNKQSPILRRTGLYIAVAFELPSMIFGGLLVGYLLDDYFGTSPWLVISLTAIAFVGAIVRLVQWLNFFSRERDDDQSGSNDYPAH